MVVTSCGDRGGELAARVSRRLEPWSRFRQQRLWSPTYARTVSDNKDVVVAQSLGLCRMALTLRLNTLDGDRRSGVIPRVP